MSQIVEISAVSGWMLDFSVGSSDGSLSAGVLASQGAVTSIGASIELLVSAFSIC